MTGETQKDIEALAEEKEMLEEALEETELNLEENQSILEELQSKSKEDRRQRAATATTVSMGISTEKDVLLSQLRQLKLVSKPNRNIIFKDGFVLKISRIIKILVELNLHFK